MTRAWLRPHLRLQLDDLRVLLLHFLSQQLDLDVRAENLARITLLSERHVDIAALRPVGAAVAAQPIADTQRQDHLALTRARLTLSARLSRRARWIGVRPTTRFKSRESSRAVMIYDAESPAHTRICNFHASRPM